MDAGWYYQFLVARLTASCLVAEYILRPMSVVSLVGWQS